jgi:hypothetical protein
MIFAILCFVTFFKFGVGIRGYSLPGGPSRVKQGGNPYCETWLDNQDHDTCEISISPRHSSTIFILRVHYGYTQPLGLKSIEEIRMILTIDISKI